MTAGLVSTIIPVFNRGAMLSEAVASVLAQTWRPIEIIVVDDGSTDDTLAVALALAAQDDCIRVMRQANSGPGVARESGLQVAQGEFVQFLDSDDLLLPEKFRLQVESLRADGEAGISYGKCYSSSRGVRMAEPAQSTGQVYRTLFPALLDGPIWPTLTPLYRRSALAAIGPWPARRLLEDWIFDGQAGALGIPLTYIDQFVSETRDHEHDRLCHRWLTDPDAMAERLAAYPVLLEQGRRAGVARESAVMQRFARTLFFMARTAGASGHYAAADELLALAREQATQGRRDLRLWSWIVSVLGWRLTCRLAGVAGHGRR